MFDTIYCEVPLPDGYRPKDGAKHGFQSKDLDCDLLEHRIGRDGFHRGYGAWVRVPLSEIKNPTEWEVAEKGTSRRVNKERPESITEVIDFYTIETLPEKMQAGRTWNARLTVWHQYEATFREGRLLMIRTWAFGKKRDRHMMTVPSKMASTSRNFKQGRYAGRKGRKRTKDFGRMIGVKHEHRYVVVDNHEVG
jgi:hypothetical protein